MDSYNQPRTRVAGRPAVTAKEMEVSHMMLFRQSWQEKQIPEKIGKTAIKTTTYRHQNHLIGKSWQVFQPLLRDEEDEAKVTPVGGKTANQGGRIVVDSRLFAGTQDKVRHPANRLHGPIGHRVKPRQIA
jgi:hypothetical protein